MMHLEHQALSRLLVESLGKGGDDARIKNAQQLLIMASRPGRSLETRISANGPTFLEAIESALATVPR